MSVDASQAEYTFVGGFPAAETLQKAYDEADLNRAVIDGGQRLVER